MQRLDRLADAPVTPAERDQLLHAAFPNEFHTVEALALHHHIPVIRLGNLNSPEVAQRLAGIAPDLGVVLGTRILKSSTFSVPRLGSINLHKGQVPDYRSMPPGFWEVYDTQASAGVTVHFVDAGLDTGKIVLACHAQYRAVFSTHAAMSRQAPAFSISLASAFPNTIARSTSCLSSKA